MICKRFLKKKVKKERFLKKKVKLGRKKRLFGLRDDAGRSVRITIL